MAGVESLEKIGGLAASNLSHNDMIRPVAEGVFDKIPDGHAAGPVSQPARQTGRLRAGGGRCPAKASYRFGII